MRAALWMYTLVALPTVVRGQAPINDGVARGARSFGAWVGTSLSPAAVFGTITDRHLFLSGLRLEYVLNGGSGVTTTYTFDIHPLAVVTNTPLYGLQLVEQRNGRFIMQMVETGRSPVLGAGVSPLGVQLYSRPAGAARFFAGGSAGGIWFNRDMPVADARRFNFALQLGAGAELTSHSGGVLVLGYKFHHLSNAGTAAANPGVDAHLIYIGLMRRRAAGRGGGEVAGK